MNTYLIRALVSITLIAASGICSVCSLAELREADLKKSIVNIKSYRGNVLIKEGTGFVVQGDRYNGYVVTNASLISGNDSLAVTVPGSGAELTAQITMTDTVIDFAKLKVNGLNLPALRFSAAEPRTGDIVWSGIKWNIEGSPIGLSKGVLKSTDTLFESNIDVLNHSAVVGQGDNGSVLLNECGEVIGLNMSQPGAEAGVRAISAGSLISLLKQQNIKVNQAATACISPISIAIEKANLAATEAEKAKEKALQAERIVKALESKLAASNQRNQKLSSEINQARLSAEKALVSAAETEETARKTRSDLEEKTESILSENRSMVEHLNQDRIDAEDRYRRALEEQKQASESRELMLISFFIVFVVVVSVFLLMLVRGLPARSQKAALLDNQIADKQIADKPIADVPPPMMYRSSETQLDEPAEYVLEGRDEDGIRYLLRISGDRLMRNDGVVIGRNPQDSPYVINHADVSRKHARMKVMKDRVFIEDLGSTNGTSVNGQTIDSKGPVSVASGDQIIIGSVVMKLRVLNE